MTWLSRWARRVSLAAILALTTLVVGGACQARWRLPDLKPWHRISIRRCRCGRVGRKAGHVSISIWPMKSSCLLGFGHSRRQSNPAERTPVNRYHAGSLSHSSSARPPTGIRSFESVPPEQIRAGALLIHGLTDSPYSMRSIADVLRKARRVFVGTSHARSRHGSVGPGRRPRGARLARRRQDGRATRAEQDSPQESPLVLVGYSNGGALAVDLHAERHRGKRRPGAVEAAVAVANDRRHASSTARVVDQFAWRGACTSRNRIGWMCRRNITRSITRSPPMPRFKPRR